MPQLNSLSLTDRAPTPATHNLVPVRIADNLGTVEESSGVPVGNLSASYGVKKTAGGRYSAIFKIAMPIVQTETINGVSNPRVVRTAYADLKLTYDPTSTTQERANLVGLLASALDPAKAQVNDVIVGLQAVY